MNGGPCWSLYHLGMPENFKLALALNPTFRIVSIGILFFSAVFNLQDIEMMMMMMMKIRNEMMMMMIMMMRREHDDDEREMMRRER